MKVDIEKYCTLVVFFGVRVKNYENFSSKISCNIIIIIITNINHRMFTRVTKINRTLIFCKKKKCIYVCILNIYITFCL